MADLATDATPNGNVATPETEPTTTTNGTVSLASDARQSAPGEDTFLPQGLDTKTLPPAVRDQLEKINQDMIRGFKAKTEKLAEAQKKYQDYDSHKSKSELYDQFASREDFKKMWNEYAQKLATNPAQNDTEDPERMKMQQRLDEVEGKIHRAEMLETIDAFSEAVNEKGEKLHADFDKFNGIMLGEIADGGNKAPYSLLRAAIELSPGNTPQERLDNGYKKVREIHDQIFEAGRKSGMGRMLSKVRNSTDIPSPVSTDKDVFNGDAKKLSAREARELAMKGISVRD